MTCRVLTTTALLATLAVPFAAHAQGGAAAGAATGAVTGAVVGGPVGAAVGAVGGAVVGGLAEEQQPQFRQYVVQQGVPSRGSGVGAVLPPRGVTYYEVPAQYGARGYRYTRVNNRIVLVDPRTHRIVQVVQ